MCIRDSYEERGHDDHRNDDGKVGVGDGLDRRPAQSAEAEDLLADDGPAEQTAQVETGSGDDRGERCAQPVACLLYTSRCV